MNPTGSPREPRRVVGAGLVGVHVGVLGAPLVPTGLQQNQMLSYCCQTVLSLVQSVHIVTYMLYQAFNLHSVFF